MAADNFKQLKEAEQNKIQSFSFVIGMSVCVLFSICFTVSSLAEVGLPQEIDLGSRINPNDAPLASLVRLPGIGSGRAEAIVDYRKNFAEQEGQRQAFETIDDLQKVKGIGPKTAENINEWLKFE